MDIVIASHNVHKIREFREMLKKHQGLDVLSLLNFPDYQAPEETGSTFQENAELKALHAAKTLNKYVLADDSGIVVPALNGRPGVYSRRYAGEDATDAENRQKLLKEMETFSDIERSAYYECCLTIASPKGIIKSVTGYCEGLITDVEKGSNGFGYDAIFIKHDYDKTFGELTEETKNRISHRHKALEKLSTILDNLKL